MTNPKYAAIAARSQGWRLNHLYMVVPKLPDGALYDGEGVLYEQNAVQQALYAARWYRNVIPKARQLGVSTGIQVEGMDHCLFTPNFRMGIIAETEDLAEAHLADRIKFAYHRLPQFIRDEVRMTKDNEKMVRFSNGSVIRVGVSLRGHALDFLHVSEYGKICAKRDDLAKEIKTGSLNTLGKNAIAYIESTAMGRLGDFYEMCQQARRLEQTGRQLTTMDWRLHFFGWSLDPEYQLDLDLQSESYDEYFRDLEKNYNVRLNRRQRNWYIAKAGEQKRAMKQEFPSTFDEAFEQTIEGAVYGAEMQRVRYEERIGKVPHRRVLPVHTFWDLGRVDLTSIWFMQRAGGIDNFIRYYQHNYAAPAHYIDMLRELEREYGYQYGKMVLPHDGAHVSFSSVAGSFADILYSHGFDVDVIKVPPSKLYAIEQARIAMDSVQFDERECAQGITCLEEVHWAWDKTERRLEEGSAEDTCASRCRRLPDLRSIPHGRQCAFQL